MADYTYPLRVLRHEFAKQVVESEYMPRNIIASMVAGVVLTTGSIYYMVDERTDDITSSPSVMSDINNRLTSLKEQKAELLMSKNDIADYIMKGINTDELEIDFANQSSAFKTASQDFFNVILAKTEKISEENAEVLINDFATNVREDLKPRGDIGFLHECQASSDVEDPSRTLSTMADDVQACMADSNTNKSTMVFGLLGLLAPIFIRPNENEKLKKWAQQKPRRNNRNVY